MRFVRQALLCLLIASGVCGSLSSSELHSRLEQIHSRSKELFHGETASFDFLRAASGADEAAKITHRRLERNLGSGDWLIGDLFIVHNPLEHFHILEPIGGCQHQSRSRVSETMNASHCLLAMNGGYFVPRTGECLGNLVADSKIVQLPGKTNAGFGITQDGRFVIGYIPSELVESGHVKHLVTGVMWLVRNHQPYVDISKTVEDMSAQMTGGDFITVKSARTAIGVDAAGKLMLLLINGKTWHRGIDLARFAELLVELGAQVAINLDGGGSATLVESGIVINYPSDECEEDPKFACERKVSSIVCIK